jgi:hypothetical protein
MVALTSAALICQRGMAAFSSLPLSQAVTDGPCETLGTTAHGRPPGQRPACKRRFYWIQTLVKSNSNVGLSTASCSLAAHTVSRIQ